MNRYCLLALPALWAAAAPASAATYVYTGTTTGGPTYNRATTTTVLSAVGTAVNYNVFAFTVSASGSYTLLNAAPTYDGFLSLYQTAFNPQSALTNVVSVNDDGPGNTIGEDGFITAALTAGTSYFAVMSAFNNGVSGAFTLTLNGPGTITPAAAVPEPATWAMLLTGFAMVGGAIRYRRRKTVVAFA